MSKFLLTLFLLSIAFEATLFANEVGRIPEETRKVILTPKPQSIPSKYKSQIRYLPVTLLAFEETFQQKRVQNEIDKFNQIYSQCGIQLSPEIPIHILSSQGISLVYTSWDFGSCEPSNEYWQVVQRRYAKGGIPITYLLHDGGDPRNAGSSQRRESVRFQPSTEEVRKRQQALCPRYAAYLHDYTKPPYLNRVQYENGIVTFSHEVGHLILDEGHNGDRPNFFHEGNLMASFDGDKKGPQRSKATKLTQEQCNKARRFIETYNPIEDQPVSQNVIDHYYKIKKPSASAVSDPADRSMSLPSK